MRIIIIVLLLFAPHFMNAQCLYEEPLPLVDSSIAPRATLAPRLLVGDTRPTTFTITVSADQPVYLLTLGFTLRGASGVASLTGGAALQKNTIRSNVVIFYIGRWLPAGDSIFTLVFLQPPTFVSMREADHSFWRAGEFESARALDTRDAVYGAISRKVIPIKKKIRSKKRL